MSLSISKIQTETILNKNSTKNSSLSYLNYIKNTKMLTPGI